MFLAFSERAHQLIGLLVGSMLKSVSLLVLVSSPMRESLDSGRECLLMKISYDIFAINIASTMLGYVYGKGTKPGFRSVWT